ncbi:hypothetical protein ES708_17770 [subsurface metagenome]
MKMMAKGSTNIPRKKEIAIIAMTTSQGFIPSPIIISVMKTVPPALANTAAKAIAPKKIHIVKPVILKVWMVVSLISFQLSRRWIAQAIRTATTPSEPASVGVAIPAKIDPKTASIIRIGKITVLREVTFSFRVNFWGWGGHNLGLSQALIPI